MQGRHSTLFIKPLTVSSISLHPFRPMERGFFFLNHTWREGNWGRRDQVACSRPSGLGLKLHWVTSEHLLSAGVQHVFPQEGPRENVTPEHSVHHLFSWETNSWDFNWHGQQLVPEHLLPMLSSELYKFFSLFPLPWEMSVSQRLQIDICLHNR